MILHGIEYQRPTSLNMRILADHVTYSFLAFMKSIFHFCLGCYCGGYSQNGRSNLSSFLYFCKEIRVCEIHYGKTDFGGVRIWNKEQSEFFGMFRLTPWIRERFFHFRDPCFLVLLWENEWMDLHEFSIICQARHEKWSSRLCHA